MKLLIFGGRDWSDKLKFVKAMIDFVSMYGYPEEVVSGGCPTGADRMGEHWAELLDIPLKFFAADWNEYGKAAGPIRNKQMAAYCDRAIGFWDGQSKGSKNMIDNLQKADKSYTIIYP